MGLEKIGSSSIVHEITKPLENGIGKQAQSSVKNEIGAAVKFVRNPADSLSDVFASRTGISTALNPFKLQLAKTPEPPKDRQFDGFFVGNGKQTFAPNTPLSQIPAVTPKNGIRNNETLIYVNGIITNVAGQSNSLQAVADQTGSRVIGIHNATGGFGADVLQSLGDKLDIGRNPAVDTMANAVYSELKAGRSVHLIAHSQGALVTSRALADVKNRLMIEDGMSKKAAENLLSNVKVETFGGASRRFPDGPRYVHYVNRNDGVPQAFGLRSWLNPFAHAGNGAVTHYFTSGKPVISHGFEEFYLPERVPFEQAIKNQFK